MRKDFLGEIVSEQKLLAVIQITILIIMIILLILNSGRTNTEKKEAICGDGILDKKETAETCCLDAGCGESMSCLKEGENFMCQLLNKEDTSSFKEFKNLGKTLINQAYNFEEAEQEISISKNLMQKSIDKMKEKGFQTTVEEESYETITKHLETIKIIDKINKETTELEKNTDFLEVFYLDGGEPLLVNKELNIIKNNSEEAIKIISEFQNQINNISIESKEQLQTIFNLDTNKLVTDYTYLLDGFNETNIKAKELLS